MRQAYFAGSLLAALLCGCASAPGPMEDHAVAPVAVPAIVHPQQETAAWWFRAGAATEGGTIEVHPHETQ